jgi:hypothetical protein
MNASVFVSIIATKNTSINKAMLNMVSVTKTKINRIGIIITKRLGTRECLSDLCQSYTLYTPIINI